MIVCPNLFDPFSILQGKPTQKRFMHFGHKEKSNVPNSIQEPFQCGFDFVNLIQCLKLLYH